MQRACYLAPQAIKHYSIVQSEDQAKRWKLRVNHGKLTESAVCSRIKVRRKKRALREQKLTQTCGLLPIDRAYGIGVKYKAMADCSGSASDCTVLPQKFRPVAQSIPDPADSCAETSRSRPEFRWTAATRKAVALVAEDQITNAAIAENCRISPRTLGAWKQHPDFRAEVEKHKSLISEDVLAFSIARRIERVRALDRIHTKLNGLVEGAAEPDPAYLKEVREYQRQAAIEVGQWQESSQQLKPGEQRLTITYDAIQQLQQAEPERWAMIQRTAAAIQRGEIEYKAAPALAAGQVVDAVEVEQAAIKRKPGRPKKVWV